MGTISLGSNFYWRNPDGWNTGTVGGSSGYAGYISTKSDGRVSIQPITITPATGKAVKSISFTFGVTGGSGSATSIIYGQAYNSLANAKTGGTTGTLGNQGSVSVWPDSAGWMWTVNLTGLNITASTTIYVLLWSNNQKHGGVYMQYWTKASGDIKSKPYASITSEVANGLVRIYTSSGWKSAIPYVYTSGGWKQAIPYIYTSGGWKQCG